MAFWASLDHEMRYKREEDVPASLRAELRECAEAAAALDDRMQSIHRRLTQTQPPDARVIE